MRCKTAVVTRNTLLNVGPISATWFASVGIHTLADLRKVGVINAYNLVRAQGYNVSYNLLWALHGALTDTHWTKISATDKYRLKQRLQDSA